MNADEGQGAPSSKRNREQAAGNVPSASIRISLRVVAIAFGAVGLASLSTLIVVASVNGSDALSTTALVLAILSFLVQIVVYVAEAWTSSQRQVHAEQLHAESRALLERIALLAARVDANLVEQQGRVLDRLINVGSRAVITAGSAEVESDQSPEDVRERIAKEVADQVANEVQELRDELARRPVLATTNYDPYVTASNLQRSFLATQGSGKSAVFNADIGLWELREIQTPPDDDQNGPDEGGGRKSP